MVGWGYILLFVSCICACFCCCCTPRYGPAFAPMMPMVMSGGGMMLVPMTQQQYAAVGTSADNEARPLLGAGYPNAQVGPARQLADSLCSGDCGLGCTCAACSLS